MALSYFARTKPAARGSAASCLSDKTAHHRHKKCTVAVVGGGAAGLAAAKELQEEGHKVNVFEKSHSIGGVWVLDDRVESDLLGQSEARSVVHSSLYESLRVNLPREAMSFSDFPFLPEFMKGRSQDTRRFPHHVEVRRYLEAYAEHFDLQKVVNLDTEVLSVVPVPSSDSTGANSTNSSGSTTSLYSLSRMDSSVSWKVTSATGDAAAVEPTEQVYDAVMICNGHYTTPRLPPVEGIEQFPGRCEHSHNYRRPGPYEGLKVLLVGAHASGEDIAWELSSYAREVVLCAKTWMKEEHGAQVAPFGPHGNMYRRKWVQELRDDGSVLLEDGTSVESVDVVMFCTGYHYSMPFLQDGIVDTTRSHVRPLYQHLMTQQYGPSLSFIGLPFKIIPFPQFELQCKYVARMLSGRAQVPAPEEMEAWIHAHYKFAEQTGMVDRHLHLQSDAQWEYNAWLAEQCGPDVAPVEEWRIDLWRIVRRLKKSHENDVYRDIWDDPEAGDRAQAALAKRFAELNSVPEKTDCLKSQVSLEI